MSIANANHVPVEPVATAAGYIGGKRILSRRIVSIIEGVPHRTYVEPFVGMGGVFLKRSLRPPAEVINDISGDVTNLFRILQRHYPQFVETLRFQITSRREFERLGRADPSTLTDLERACRFLYLQRLAFGGKVASRNFGISIGRGAAFNLTRLATTLEEIHERLSGVVIENLSWHQVVARYDRPDTLFYIDPPYWGNEDDYGAGVFEREDFSKLNKILSKIRGKFVMSINDRPEVRAVFEGFCFESVESRYSISRGGREMESRELLVTSRNNR